MRPIGRPVWLLGPGVLWLLVFGLAPLLFMLMMSFWTSSMFGTRPDFQFDNYARVIVTELYRDQLIKTLRIALMTTAMTLVISYPVAYLLSRLKGMRKALFVLMMFLPFWTSYVIRAFVWLPILGRNGAINNTLLALGDRRRAARLAALQRGGGVRGARVRLHPVHDPARLSVPGEDRPRPHRGRDRPRGPGPRPSSGASSFP